jgi:hypothetical protein
MCRMPLSRYQEFQLVRASVVSFLRQRCLNRFNLPYFTIRQGSRLTFIPQPHHRKLGLARVRIAYDMNSGNRVPVRVLAVDVVVYVLFVVQVPVVAG